MDFDEVFFFFLFLTVAKQRRKIEGHLTANNALLWKGLCPPKAEEHFCSHY